jgi:two-component system chemotaxis sensor kinase CheA
VTEPDAEIVHIFREEANERLDRIVETLLALEAEQASDDAIDSLFRDMHSIKGSAGMVGIEEARSIAAAVEDLLEEVRERDSFPVDLTESLLQATDTLRRAVAGEESATDRVLEDLVSSFRGSGGKGRPKGRKRRSGQNRRSGSDRRSGKDRRSAKERRRGTEGRSIRVPAEKVDRVFDAIGETVLHARQLEHIVGNGARADGADERIESELSHGELVIDELQDAAMQMRTLPLSSITGPFARAVRDLAAAEGKDVELEISGAETQLDRMILEGISESITHLLRNAVAHGIEPPDERESVGKPAVGHAELRAEQRANLVAIEVSDDGRGVSPELLQKAEQAGSLAEVLARAGFSTAVEVTEVAGRGVGLDAVKSQVESLGGGLEISSEEGSGTTVTLLLPLTFAMLRVLLVERGGQAFGLPLASVEEVARVTETLSLTGKTAIEVRGRSIPLADLAAIIGGSAPQLPERPPALIVTSSGRRVAAVCDRMLGEEEVVVKSLGPLLSCVAGHLGAAILGEGRVALILDPAFLTKTHRRGATTTVAPKEKEAPPKVLVVDDQFTVRELQRSILEAAGYRVETARDGREALTCVSGEGDVELVVTDIQMPEMDGIELLKAIREDQEHSSLPVVIITAQAGEEERRRGAEAGADAYVLKHEFDQRALLDTVERLIGR